ncbi:YadA-like family protein [Pseudomonas sp.]|uniref:YadA-like family protein n=1 Tax=Pseudomonas sp. TaxID=306 RepID=UPI0025E98237|nr:YadA-like family protein [Pseudomonas sp.]
MAAGTASTDAVNVSQLTPLVTALGGGAAFNSSTGAITAPSYLLTNANSIAGTSGAAADVGTGFGKVDAALGKVNAMAAKTNRYFKASGKNDGTDDASASGNSVAIGANASASSAGNSSVAIGENAKATYGTGIALGLSATSNGAGIAIGTAATTTSVAGGEQQIALGAGATTTTAAATALGYNASASKANSVALGNQSVADRANSVSIGNGSLQRQMINMAAGTASTDAVNVSQLTPLVTALGGGAAFNSGTGAITAPSYLLTNANSIAGTSGAAADVGTGFAKVDSALGKLNTSITTINNGGGIKYFHVNSALADSSATGANSTAIGPAAVASGNSGVVIGNGANSAVSNAVAVGTSSKVDGSGSVAIGADSYAFSSGSGNGQSVAVGAGANAHGDFSTSLGGLSKASAAATAVGVNAAAEGDRAIALGASSNASGGYSMALGVNSTATATNAVALGNGANASLANSVAIGNGATTSAAVTTSSGTIGGKTYTYAGGTPTGVFSVGSASATRQVQNVAAGQVSAASTDAVNGSQLFATNAQVTQNTTDINTLNTTISNMGVTTDAVVYDSSAHTKVTFGAAGTPVQLANVKAGELSAGSLDAVNGSQLFATNQQVAQNTTDIAGNTTSITNLDGRVTTVEGDVSNLTTNINSGTIGLVQQSAAGENLTVGKDTDGAAVDFAGTDGARKLINVADGTLAADSKDAVNGGQLFATNQQVDQNTSDIAGNTTSITNLDGRVTQNTTDINSINTNITNMGDTLADAVMYDSSAHDKVTFGAAGTPVQLTNVKAGELSADSLDAVNGSQLFATNQQVDQNTSDIAGNTTSITNLDGRVTQNTTDINSINTNITNMGDTLADAVMYDSSAHDKVTFGAAGTPVQLTNVKAGELSADSLDAVNGSQLFATNQQVDQNTTDIAGNTTSITNLDGRVTTVEGDITDITNNINAGTIGLVQQSAAGENLTVGKDTDGAAVDFAGTDGARKLINVADGTVASGSKDAVNGGQLFGVSQSVADAMGGGSIVNADGSISAPSYSVTNVDGSTTNVNNVGDAITNLDGRTTQNTTDINSINTNITNMGDTLADAVMYDSSAHDKVTFGTAGTPVQLTNVKAGELSAESLDAVNGSQLFATNEQVAQNTTDIAGNTTSITNLDGRVTQNTTDINSINTNITNMGDTLADAVMYDSSAHDKVTFGAAGTPVQLTNVKAGELSAESLDAVNGSQLFATNQQVDQNTTDISSITNNINSGTIGLVQQSAAGENLTVGKDTDGAAVDFVGTDGARKLINVADGTLAVDSKDAVNGSQLFATNEQVAQNTTDIAGNTTSITNLDGRVTQNTTDINSINTNITNMGDTLADAVMYDSSAHDKVTFGTAGTPVQLTNVKAGELSAESLDAVNGSQLFATNEQVAQNTTDIAGNTTSITNLDGRVTQNTTDINSINTNITNMGDTLADAVMYDSSAHDKVTFGAAGTPVQLTNVKAGELSAESLDAVNGSQLFATNQQVDQNTSDIAGNTMSITNLDGRVTQNTTDINSINTNITNMGDTLADAVMYDSSAHDKVTFGAAGTPVQLTNVKAGELSADSLDAVNGSQLFATNQQVDQNTTDISSITNNINAGTIGLVQQSAAGENLTVGKDTDGAAVDFAGTDGARKLINVADGTVASGSKDAVNGGQLFGVSQSVADAMGGGSVVNTDGSISAPSYSVTNVDGSITNVSNVGDAISNIDGRVANNTTSITNLDGRVTTVEGDITDITNNINSGTIGLVQQSAAGENLTVGKDTDGAAVDFAGTDGARKLINVADGTVASGSKDAVNGGQLFGVSQSVADAMGGGSAVNADGSISAPSYSVTNVDGSITNVSNVGDAITNLDGRTAQNTTDINTINNSITSLNGVMGDAVMYDSAAHDKVTLGTAGKAVQLTNIKAGELSASSSDAVNGAQLYETNNKVAVIDGRVTNLEGSVTNIVNGGGVKYFHTSSTQADSVASGADSIAVGGKAVASGEGSVALGDGANASAKGSVAVGQGASDNGRGAESYTGRYSGMENVTLGTVSFGNATTGETRTLSNVADAKQATDAVNLRQLDGAVAESKSYTDSKVAGITDGMADSIAKVDNRVTKVENDVTNVQNGTDGMFQVKNSQNLPKPKATGNSSVAGGAGAEAVADNSTAIGNNAKAKGKNSVALGANSVAERDNSVAVGSAGNERQITHVAAGTQRTDAVNVGQVSDALTAMGNESNQRYNDLKNDISEQDDRLSAGIAGAIAIASLPQPMVNGGSTTAVGMGTFNGQSAVSVGMSHVSNDGKWTTKLGGSTDTQGRFSAGGSVGYNW